MANELNLWLRAGLTVYALIFRPSDGMILDVVNNAWHMPGVAAIANCKVAMVIEANSLYYTGNMPALAAGNYDALFFVQVGAQPSWTADRAAGSCAFAWDGAHEIFLIDSALLALIKQEVDSMTSIVNAINAKLATGTAVLISAAIQNNNFTLQRGVDYEGGDNASPPITLLLPPPPDLTGCNCDLVDPRTQVVYSDFTVTPVSPGLAGQTITISIAGATLAGYDTGRYRYALRVRHAPDPDTDVTMPIEGYFEVI